MQYAEDSRVRIPPQQRQHYQEQQDYDARRADPYSNAHNTSSVDYGYIPSQVRPAPRVDPFVSQRNVQDVNSPPRIRQGYNQSLIQDEQSVSGYRYQQHEHSAGNLNDTTSSRRRSYAVRDTIDGFGPIPARGRGGIDIDASTDLRDSDFELISWQKKHGFNTRRGNTPVLSVIVYIKKQQI
jgi:hypothetical protein